MFIKHGGGSTVYGPGVSIELTGCEIVTAIEAYLVAHGKYTSGPQTFTVNGVIFQFHHINPEEKDFEIGSNLEKPFNVLCEEVQKCDLYCANCHFILHIGEY